MNQELNDNDSFNHDGILVVKHKYDIIFEQEIELNMDLLPKLKPSIIIHRDSDGSLTN